jgi:hypothetical protein
VSLDSVPEPVLSGAGEIDLHETFIEGKKANREGRRRRITINGMGIIA